MLIMLHIDIGPLIPFPVVMFRIPDMIYRKKIGQVNWSITINSKSSLTLSPKLMVNMITLFHPIQKEEDKLISVNI